MINKSTVNNLIYDFYKFIYSSGDNYSQYYDDVTGHFDFGLLMDDFKTVIITKLGKKGFVKILQNLMMVNESTNQENEYNLIYSHMKEFSLEYIKSNINIY